MELARVLGQVVSTAKHEGFAGFTLLLLHPVDASGGEIDGTPTYVAIDLTGAGTGEVVLVTRGGGARVPTSSASTPTDAAVVAIVDSVSLGQQTVFSTSS
ncbi:MAG: putative ethanolamine utilization protein EutN [Nocardioides sp.]|jgi:microcompartment protein CcmK/EutM|uniref:EutN/CcmL family microcompartment protein n=1 Tax=Nocardioides sp. TaxID=35761 RepID=UPI0026310CCB|nr:EutN/CcmL family microcompartment protein [Nocardioides sp.]MCW2833017.1 putative ethanolamine utilization protein EutN [Nocardioides sp.]